MTSQHDKQHDARPDILMIVCDQLTTRVLGCYDGPYACTPQIDALAKRGSIFDKAYTHTPLCQPARAAMWTGRYPHETGVLGNGGPRWPHVDKPIPQDMPTLGNTFTNAGYRAIHFGKTHDMGALAGFDIINPQGCDELPVATAAGYPVNDDSFRDAYAAREACNWLASYDDEQPALAIVDLNNPHNICQWVGEHAGVEQDELTAEEDARLPALPANFDADDFSDRPLPVQYVCCMHRRQGQASRWPASTWRRYIDAYQHYTRMVDAQVGQVLDALAKRKRQRPTWVILTADHGDGLASHRLATKHTTFYDNITRVPFIIVPPEGSEEKPKRLPALTSLLEVFPTLCNIAHIAPPKGLAGRSVLPWVNGQAPRDWRACLISQWHTEWGHTISPGRMVRSERYKYTHYLEGDGEQLFDMQSDPGETRNLCDDPSHAKVLATHRAMLREYTRETGDPYFSLDVFVPPKFRAHAPGYEHHDPAADLLKM